MEGMAGVYQGVYGTRVPLRISKEIKSVIDADPHPLATMRHAPLFSSLATYDGTPTVLSALAR
jgi:hypothetical protein